MGRVFVGPFFPELVHFYSVRPPEFVFSAPPWRIVGASGGVLFGDFILGPGGGRPQIGRSSHSPLVFLGCFFVFFPVCRTAKPDFSRHLSGDPCSRDCSLRGRHDFPKNSPRLAFVGKTAGNRTVREGRDPHFDAKEPVACNTPNFFVPVVPVRHQFNKRSPPPASVFH